MGFRGFVGEVGLFYTNVAAHLISSHQLFQESAHSSHQYTICHFQKYLPSVCYWKHHKHHLPVEEGINVSPDYFSSVNSYFYLKTSGFVQFSDQTSLFYAILPRPGKIN